MRVGIIDTGIDGNHPDIAPNFDRALSRNFTGRQPRRSTTARASIPTDCVDPADVDDDGHGTHVAGTIGAAAERHRHRRRRAEGRHRQHPRRPGLGLLLPPADVDALTYAGDNGIDVVNMSFYIDPWLYNCTRQPGRLAGRAAGAADDHRGDAARGEVRARRTGVTLVAAAGNEYTDLGHPTSTTRARTSRPDAAKERDDRQRDCLNDADRGATASSPSRPSARPATAVPRKAYYSNYGVEQTDVVGAGRRLARVLRHAAVQRGAEPDPGAYPLNVAQACQEVDATGVPTGLHRRAGQRGRRRPRRPRWCATARRATCALYQWIQGTSMASPHAVGVAALIVAAVRQARPRQRRPDARPGRASSGS